MYRYRLARVPKDMPIRDMGPVQLYQYLYENCPEAIDGDEDNTIMIFRIIQDDIFDFGSCPLVDEIIANSNRFFTNTFTEDKFEENHIRVCDKRTLRTAIEGIRKLILESYDRLCSLPDNALRGEIQMRKGAWFKLSEIISEPVAPSVDDTASLPYNMDEDNDRIVDSYLWEYQIFELVKIYKTFDFNKYDLVFLGW